ncbi:MAG TPA: hypothetical protein DCZ91_12605 [Lachnospiraceae bacterium]|nr:hypothetical protein [Lachnospiraceae bacterium]
MIKLPGVNLSFFLMNFNLTGSLKQITIRLSFFYMVQTQKRNSKEIGLAESRRVVRGGRKVSPTGLGVLS